MATAADFSEAFDSSLGNYPNIDGTGAWDNTTGHTSTGCAKLTDGGSWLYTADASPPLVISSSANPTLTFYYRIINGNGRPSDSIIEVRMWNATTNFLSGIYIINFDDVSTADTGWIEATVNIWSSPGTENLVGIAILLPNSETGYDVYIDDIVLASSPVTFYSGTNTLTSRAALAISDVQRGGMVIRNSGDAIVATADNTDTAVVLHGTAADSFATWTNITNSHPTGRVTSLQEV